MSRFEKSLSKFAGVVLFGFLLVSVVSGCQSVEYSKAVKDDASPWYMVTITSPDIEIHEGEMSIYKLLRRADSPEGQREKLESDKSWGEGHKTIRIGNDGTINIHIQISQDKNEKEVCDFQLHAINFHEKSQAYFSLEMHKLDGCEKREFNNPFLSGRMQIVDGGWKNLNFSFRHLGAE